MRTGQLGLRVLVSICLALAVADTSLGQNPRGPGRKGPPTDRGPAFQNRGPVLPGPAEAADRIELHALQQYQQSLARIEYLRTLGLRSLPPQAVARP